jgi:hypothetical protein
LLDAAAMEIHVRQTSCACLFAVFAVGIPAQSTFVVGPSGLPDISAALALAAPGDRIHVEAGTYPPFQATLGVTIRAIGVQTVTISPLAMPLGGPMSADIPSGQSLHLVGLQLTTMSILGGRVTFDRCHFNATGTNLVIANATAHLQDCRVSTGLGMSTQPALSATNADVTAVGCDFDSFHFPSSPAPTIAVTGSRLHFTHCTVRLQTPGTFPGAALRATGGSQVWLSDSTVVAPSASSCAIDSTGSTLRVDRCNGCQSANPSCSSPQAGPPLLGVDRAGPLTPGGVFALDFRGEPNGFVIVFAGSELATVNWQPILEQPSWLAESHSFSAALLLTDALGAASISWQLPANPAIADQVLWFKGIGGLTLPLQASPVVGGVAR